MILGDLGKVGRSTPFEDNFTLIINGDEIVPFTNISISGPSYLDTSLYVNHLTEFTLNAIDNESGVDITWYRIFNDNEWTNWIIYTNPIHFYGVGGELIILYNSTDNVGVRHDNGKDAYSISNGGVVKVARIRVLRELVAIVCFDAAPVFEEEEPLGAECFFGEDRPDPGVVV